MIRTVAFSLACAAGISRSRRVHNTIRPWLEGELAEDVISSQAAEANELDDSLIELRLTQDTAKFDRQMSRLAMILLGLVNPVAGWIPHFHGLRSTDSNPCGSHSSLRTTESCQPGLRSSRWHLSLEPRCAYPIAKEANALDAERKAELQERLKRAGIKTAKDLKKVKKALRSKMAAAAKAKKLEQEAAGGSPVVDEAKPSVDKILQEVKLTLSRVAPEDADEMEPDFDEFLEGYGVKMEPLEAVKIPTDNEIGAMAGTHDADLRTPKKKKPIKLSKEAKSRVGCYGCGAELQTNEPSAAGYVEQDRYDLKNRYRQLRLLLCTRCRSLSNGEILPAVVEGRLRLAPSEECPDGAGVTTPDQLRKELEPLRDERIIAVLLVDLTDITGSFLPRIRDLIAGNPIILIGTKVDLLPKGTSKDKVLNWLVETLTGRLNIIDAHLVSSKTGAGVDDACQAILRERKGRNVFVLGAANCGKSLFIGSFLEEVLGGRRRQMPISSSTPGTTLKTIGIDCFDGRSRLFDTPGLHLAHRLSASLLPSELKAMIPRGKMRPYTPLPETGAGFEGCSFFWGGLVRIDVLQAPLNARFTFVTANSNLNVSQLCEGGVQGAISHYAAEVGRTLTPPLNPESAAQLGELELGRRVEVDLYELEQVCDISISGLGWISVGALASLRQSGDMRAVIDVWVPRSVSVKLRNPMPVGRLPNNVDVDETVVQRIREEAAVRSVF